MFANYFVMYILFFFVTNFFQYNNLLYKLFLFLYYWCSTKSCTTSCFQIFTLPFHITSNKFYSQWEPHNSLRYKFSECLLTTLLAAFLVVCSILQWKMSQSDSFSARPYDKFFYAKPTATVDWMSFWYSGGMFWFLWQPESI